MIVATPSITKNTISTNVSETAPPAGLASSTRPAAMPSTADSSAHQKPGACRAQNVAIRPITPLSRNSQPMKMVTPSVASGGSSTASSPSTIRTMPSMTNASQCW